MKIARLIRRTLVAAGFAVIAGQASAEQLKVVGTGDGLEMLRAVAALYLAETGEEVLLPASIGSGGGIAAVAAGTEKLARIARPLKDTEKEAGLVEVPVASLRTAFVVHPNVGVEELTTDQVTGIYAGRITDWSEVGGPAMKIRVVRREDADSSLIALRAGMPGWKDLEITDKSKIAVTTQDAIDTVRSVEGAIGFGPYSTSLDADTTVLRIDGRKPNEDGYPSAVELAFAFTKGASTPEVDKFLDYVTSDRARQLMAAYGAVPIGD